MYVNGGPKTAWEDVCPKWSCKRGRQASVRCKDGTCARNPDIPSICVCKTVCICVGQFLYIFGISGGWRCTDINILEVSSIMAYLLYYWYVSQMKSSLVASQFCVMNKSINHFDPDSLYSMWREQFFSVTEPPFQTCFRKLPSEPAAFSLCSCPTLAVSSSKGKSGADIWVTGWVHWTRQGSCQAHRRLQCSSFVFCQMEGS